ncbi:MAG: hypothetical protein AAFX87_06075 [Bacteroidota bacterium]
MTFLESECYHFYNRGNQQQIIFFSDENYLYFLRKVRKEITLYCDVLAYCLMPNHFHFLIRIKDEDHPIAPNSNGTIKSDQMIMHPLSRKIGTLQSSYTRAIQKQNGFTGSLFQQKSKSKHLEDPQYLLNCFHYIHQNPLRARLVKRMEDWPYSSYADYARLRDGKLPARQMAYEYLDIPEDGELFMKQSQEVIPDGLAGGFF